jgi:hypothetical protein
MVVAAIERVQEIRDQHGCVVRALISQLLRSILASPDKKVPAGLTGTCRKGERA